LLTWYQRNRRELPWRWRDPDPYAVLISEVMLHQTQVDRVVPYFEAFLERFPSFEALASAPRADVIRLWAGLGYNRRAVALHEAACIVVTRYGGKLPADRQTLEALPGVGRYTAGAILSIAFNQNEPALDTNARRVLARYTHEGMARSERELESAARALVPSGRSGDWNQALMDLASSVCLARRPRCLICPLREGCGAAARGDGWELGRAPSTGKYVGSVRYFRGRLLRELNLLPANTTYPLADMEGRLALQGVAEPPSGWHEIGKALERDGLVRLTETSAGASIGIA
jgi:A/G-specific adenine glycosylase